MDRMTCLFHATLALGLLCAPLPAQAAAKTVTVEARTRIVDGGREWHESRPYSFTFEVEVISDRRGPKHEGRRFGGPFVTAHPGEEYRVRIHNPLPVPVAANLSIDGLNSITGDPGSPAGGRKWIVEPFSWVDIAGWQVSDREARRFVFTSREGSYASWRSNAWQRDLAVNCGVIGVAYFWSQRALDEHYHDNPIVISRPRLTPWGREEGLEAAPRSALPPPAGAPAGKAQQRAGTGMGRHRSNPVREVRFDYDRGMYEVRDAVVIYYDFPDEGEPRPRPFEDERFAPEQPVSRWQPPYFPPQRPYWPPAR